MQFNAPKMHNLYNIMLQCTNMLQNIGVVVPHVKLTNNNNYNSFCEADFFCRVISWIARLIRDICLRMITFHTMDYSYQLCFNCSFN